MGDWSQQLRRDWSLLAVHLGATFFPSFLHGFSREQARSGGAHAL